MSSLKLNVWTSLLGANLGLMTMTCFPGIAEDLKDIKVNQPSTDIVSIKLISESDTVSTKAINLFLPIEQQRYFTNSPATTYQLVQKELDLESFCQDYPYNSQCGESNPANPNKPGVNIDPLSPIPVPVPPPNINNSQKKSGWGFVPEISTLGLGGHVVRKIVPQINTRVGVNAFGVGFDITDTELDYEGDLNLFNVSTIIDIHPAKNSGFRFSGGLIIGDNNIEGTADISEQVAEEIAEVEFDIDDLATADVDVDINNNVAPYLGIGGGNVVGEGKGLGFWWNLGVVFSGSPDIEVTANISDDIPQEFRDEAQGAADQVIEEEEEDIEDDLDFIDVYPVLSLGISYQF